MHFSEFQEQFSENLTAVVSELSKAWGEALKTPSEAESDRVCATDHNYSKSDPGELLPDIAVVTEKLFRLAVGDAEELPELMRSQDDATAKKIAEKWKARSEKTFRELFQLPAPSEWESFMSAFTNTKYSSSERLGLNIPNDSKPWFRMLAAILPTGSPFAAGTNVLHAMSPFVSKPPLLKAAENYWKTLLEGQTPVVDNINSLMEQTTKAARNTVTALLADLEKIRGGELTVEVYELYYQKWLRDNESAIAGLLTSPEFMRMVEQTHVLRSGVCLTPAGLLKDAKEQSLAELGLLERMERLLQSVADRLTSIERRLVAIESHLVPPKESNSFGSKSEHELNRRD